MKRKKRRGQARRMTESSRTEILCGGVDSLSVQKKKAAHCHGERRTWRKEAIVMRDPADSSTDKPHILELENERE